MTTKKLTDIDFMMMDVHRPMTDDEVDEINPQAAVDKTLGAGEEEFSEDAGVDRTLPRCEICFGEMPCEQHANVHQLDVITSNNISPASILAGAHNADLEHVVVVGMTKDGREYFASTMADAAEGIYYLQRGIWKLNKIVDGESISDAPTEKA